MYNLELSDKVTLKMGKFETVFLLIVFLTVFSIIGVFAETPLDQSHPLYEIDFSTGEANDDLGMSDYDIRDVDSLIADYVESINVESESITSDIVNVSEEIKFPEPSQVRFPPGTVMPMADECPPGWEEFEEGQGRVLAGLREGDDQFGSLLGIGGKDEVNLSLENLPEMTLTGRTEESDMDVSYRKADLSYTSRARNPYASIPPFPRLGPDAYTPDDDTTDIAHSHIHPIEIDMGEGKGLNNMMPYFTVEFCVLTYEPPQEMYEGGYEFDSLPETEEMDSPVDEIAHEVQVERCEDDVDDAEEFGDSNELCSEGSETSLRCPYPEDHSFYHETDNDCVAAYLLELGWMGEEVDVQENDLKIDYNIEPDHIDLGINIEPFIGTRTYYEDGKEVDIVAQNPDEIENYDVEFSGWTGDKTSDDLEITVEMTEDIEVIAEYEITDYDSDDTELYFTSELGGQVVEPGEGYYWYSSGSSLDVEVVRHTKDELDFDGCEEECEESYIFVGWDDQGEDKIQYFEEDEMYMENTFEVPDEDVILKALFEKGYHLKTDSTTGGHVEVGKDSIEGIYRIESGESVDIEGVADDMYSFVEWKGDTEVLTGNTDERVNEVVLDSDTGDAELEAVFERSEFELTVDVDGGGSTDPGEGKHTFDDGEDVIITADADDGWEFSHWEGDCSGGDVECELTMNSDKEVTAVFEEEPETYDLTVDVVGGGSTDPGEGVHSYEEGKEVTILAYHASGWEFSHWEGDCNSGNTAMYDEGYFIQPVVLPSSDECTVVMDSDKEVTAVFENGETDPDTHYDLTVDVVGGGSTNPEEGVHSYEEGKEVTISAYADDGWEFSHWDGDCNSGNTAMYENGYFIQPVVFPSSDGKCTVVMDSDKEVTAVFENGETDPDTHYDVDLVVHEDSESGAEGEGELYEGDATTMQFDELPLSDSFEEGAEVTATVRDTDYEFVEWGSGPCEGSTDNYCEFTLTDDEELGAVYEDEETIPICHDGDGVILDGGYFPCDTFPGIAGTANSDDDCDNFGSSSWSHFSSVNTPGIRMNVEAVEECLLYYFRRRSSIGHPDETGVHYINTEDWDTLNVEFEIGIMSGTRNLVRFYYGGSGWDDRDGGWELSEEGEYDYSIDVSGRDEVQIRWYGRTNDWLRFTVTDIYLE